MGKDIIMRISTEMARKIDLVSKKNRISKIMASRKIALSFNKVNGKRVRLLDDIFF